jgi:hypothetical protein
MSQRQRYARQDLARTGPPASCTTCGIHLDALPMFLALEAFADDSFESWVATDVLERMAMLTGPGALVTFCEPCFAFESVGRDGHSTRSVIS